MAVYLDPVAGKQQLHCCHSFSPVSGYKPSLPSRLSPCVWPSTLCLPTPHLPTHYSSPLYSSCMGCTMYIQDNSRPGYNQTGWHVKFSLRVAYRDSLRVAYQVQLVGCISGQPAGCISSPACRLHIGTSACGLPIRPGYISGQVVVYRARWPACIIACRLHVRP